MWCRRKAFSEPISRRFANVHAAEAEAGWIAGFAKHRVGFEI